jgi:coenzyme F420-reducing hydrogenase alpha subunit
MKKIRLTESEFVSLIKKMVNEAMSDIDNILDKISQEGMESLTQQEKEYLRHYSTTGEYMDIEDEEEMEPSFEGESFKDMIKDTPVSFTYEMTEETEKGLAHTGYITVYKDEYYGEILCNEVGTFMDANFESPEGTGLFEDYYEIQGELEMFLQNVCENLKDDLTT